MKVLIADKFEKKYYDKLITLGHELTLKPELKADNLPEEISGYEGLIVRSTKVTEATISASDNLGLIIRAGAGVNTIDIEAAAKNGIFVCNTPGKNSLAVAELAFGLFLSIDRRIPDNVMDLRKNVWNKKKYSQADGVFGKKAGIIGLGAIGFGFAERAKAFGMSLYTFDKFAQNNPARSKAAEDMGITFCDTIEDLLKISDVITIHVPSTPDTQGLVNKSFLGNMKENAILLNTSRGDIVDDEALIEAMNTKNIRAGLDVFNNEPGSGEAAFSTDLSQHPNVYGTHHIGASTSQAQNAIAAEVVEIIENFEKGKVLNSVNMETVISCDHTLSLRCYDKIGVLASVFEKLKKDGVNIQQMENIVFMGSNASCANMSINKVPATSTLEEIQALEDVIKITVKSK